MGRAPCCNKSSVKKGPWSPEEDAKLKAYIENHGTGGNWIALPQKIGLKRCGKSCRLRWLNYLRPNIKHGGFSEEEENIICSLYLNIGSRWSVIAAQLPGWTDNDIKNYWNTRLKRKLLGDINQRKQHQIRSLVSADILRSHAKDEAGMNNDGNLQTLNFQEMIPPLVKSENNYQLYANNYGFFDSQEHRSTIDSYNNTSEECSPTSNIDYALNMAALELYRGPLNYYFLDQPRNGQLINTAHDRRHDYNIDELTSLYRRPIDSDDITSSTACNIPPKLSNYEHVLQDSLVELILEDQNYFGSQQKILLYQVETVE